MGLFFFSIGLVFHFFNQQKPYSFQFNKEQKIVFQLKKKLNTNENYRKYEVDAIANLNHKQIPLNCVLYVDKERDPLDYQHYYQTTVRLNEVLPPGNAFQFNYAQYLARKHIYYQAFVYDDLLLKPKKMNWEEVVKQKRSDVLENINHSQLTSRAKDFLKGIILSDRTEMDAEMISDFSKSGLIHFLAISGSHFAIIFWLLLFLLKPLFSAKQRNYPIIISLILIWVFAIFIDYGNSVVRSCLMLTAYYGFVIFQRKPDVLHAMAIAGFGILITDTQQLFDVGFQLSFLAVLGIYWLNDPLLKLLPKPKNIFQKFYFGIISVSIAAQLATLPLVIYYFHQYSFLSIIANLIVLPFSEIIIIVSLLMALLLSVKVEFYVLDLFFGRIVDVLLCVIHFFASKNLFLVKNISLNFIEIFIVFIAIYYLRFLLNKFDNQYFIKIISVFLIFIFVRIYFNFYHINKNEVLEVNNFKQKVLLIKNNKKVIFWVKKEAKKEKILKNIVDPYLTFRRIKEYEIKELPINKGFLKVGNQSYEVE